MTRYVKFDFVSMMFIAIAVALLIYLAASGIGGLLQDSLLSAIIALAGPVLTEMMGLFKRDSESAEQVTANSSVWVVVDLAVIFSLNYFVPRVPLSLASQLTGNFNTQLAFNVLEAVSEESFIRGFFLNLFLSRVDPHTAIVADGIVFGIYHFFVYGFSPALILLVMLAGMILAYSDWRTGTLAPSMEAHVINNAV